MFTEISLLFSHFMISLNFLQHWAWPLQARIRVLVLKVHVKKKQAANEGLPVSGSVVP